MRFFVLTPASARRERVTRVSQVMKVQVRDADLRHRLPPAHDLVEVAPPDRSAARHREHERIRLDEAGSDATVNSMTDLAAAIRAVPLHC